MFISWDRFQAENVLEVPGTETVAQLRDRLLALGGAHQAALVIHLPDGRVVPTVVAQVKELAKAHGRRILQEQLAELADELCPQPWEVPASPPEHREAELKAHERRLPVVVTTDGGRVGLVRPRSEVTSFKDRQGLAFDLFDLSIPALDRALFVWVTPDTTLTHLKQALEPYRTSPMVYALLQVAEREFGVANIQALRQTLTDLAAREALPRDQFWALPLSRLEDAFEPAQVWDVEEVSDTQAQVMARSQSLVLTKGGSPAGLIPGPARSHMRAAADDLFDFFDELLPRDALIETEFVEATLNTTVAKVGLDLKSLRDAEEAYVIVRMDDGSFRMVTSQKLNEELEKSGDDVWGLPLRQFTLPLSEVERREYGTVSTQQAKALAPKEGFLLLTEKGKPIGLLPRQVVVRSGIRDAALTTTARGLLFDTSREKLEGYQDEIRPDQPREVLPLFEYGGKPYPKEQALVYKHTYQFMLSIGRYDEARSELPPEARKELPHIPPDEEGGSNLYVSLFSDDFEFKPHTQLLWLPTWGDSPAITFDVTPLRQTLDPRDRAVLTVCIYYRCNVVQVLEMSTPVVSRVEEAKETGGREWTLKAARTKDFLAVQHLTPKELNLVITKEREDHYLFTFSVDPDEVGETEWKEIRMGCRVKLTRDDLTHLITKARRQMYNAVQAYDLLRDPQTGTYRKAIRALAQVGRQLYLKLFESTRFQTGDGRALSKWMEEILPDGSTIQVVDMARDFVFPWSLVYTDQPWQDDKPVDATKFWGYRYKIVILTDDLLDTYGQAGAEIATDEPLQVCVGVHGLLLGIDKQERFFNNLNSETNGRVEPEILDRRSPMTRALKAADRDLYYFFCHGYTERIATDIQFDMDVTDQLTQLAAQAPEDRSTRLRERVDDLFDVSDSWMRLTRGLLPLTMLKETVSDSFARHPIVFLNMCMSAQVLPSLSDGFIPFFIERGARAVIGTECSMNTVFADEFARAFLSRLFQGQRIGDILLALRRHYLDRDDPLALAYTLYCDSDLRLSTPLLPASAPSASSAGRQNQDSIS